MSFKGTDYGQICVIREGGREFSERLDELRLEAQDKAGALNRRLLP